MARTFTWLTSGGGAWSLASNWDDQTDGLNPSLVPPGAGDTVTIQGGSATALATITGQGQASQAFLSGNTAFAGSFALATITLGQGGTGGLLSLGAGSALTGNAATIDSGSLIAQGTATFSLSGALTLGAGPGGASCQLDAAGGAAMAFGALTLTASAASLYVDAASSIEIGSAGNARAGYLTVDAGATACGTGQLQAYGALIDNGTILATGGTLTIGSTSGTGTLEIGAGADLLLNGQTGSLLSVLFAGASGTLALATEWNAPGGTITGFAPGDALDMRGSSISAASYSVTGANTGVLTLFYGTQVADRFILSGNYTGDTFLTAGDGGLGTLITVAPSGNGGGGGASGGTTSPDQFIWTASGGGNWNQAGNWEDVTTGANPAPVAPGKNNLVTIAAPTTGGFAVINGPANAASLAMTGDLALAGTFAIGTTITVGAGGNVPAAAIFDLLPASTLRASALALQDGSVSVSGSASLAVSGTITLGGGAPGIGLPTTTLSATAGGRITAASLTLGGGSGDTLTTDPTGIIEIGSAGNGAPGAVTIDAGANLSGNGQVNPFGTVVDNGTITASGGTLVLGALGGSGALQIATAATLELAASTTMGVTFTGANGTLALGNEQVALTGAITGFVNGDAIDILQDPITSAAINKTSGVLSLYYGSTLVSRLTLAGTTSAQRFFLVPDGAGGTLLLTDTGNGGGGSGSGQGNTDRLAWAQPGTGSWNHANSWYDVTTGKAASSPPGTLNTVQVAGPTGAQFQTIGGPGSCAGISFSGNTILSGAFATGTLALSAAIVEIGPSSSATATTASIDGGTLLVSGGSASFGVSGALALGVSTDGTLSASNAGTIRLGAITLGGVGNSLLTADVSSIVEIGNAGNAASGAVTIDAGATLSGFGAVNPLGVIVDNGLIIATGGTLTIGSASGTGTIAIGTEATLVLAGTESCAIDFSGGGATLILPGSAQTPSAMIAGFTQGDTIITAGSTITAAAFAPGTGNTGTLTLYAGAQVAGRLLLTGDFSGDIFTVTPDGMSSVIGVQTQGNGASSGTTTPDLYVWTGAAGDGAWNSAANWADTSAGQSSAAIAPGAQDLVTIANAGATYLTVTGPADAASLALLGAINLAGQYSIGGLAIGNASTQGTLALTVNAVITAASATVSGGLAMAGGLFTDEGTLTLQTGALVLSGTAAAELSALALTGTGDAVAVGSSARLDIGATGLTTQGALTVEAGFGINGAGALNVQGATVDNGTITASGGTLLLGAVSGTGTLDVGPGATLALDGAIGSSLVIDFAAGGTLAVLGPWPSAAIADFTAGDTILLPQTGITDAEYAQTAPNTGVLTLSAGTKVVGALTLFGVGADQTFSVTAGADGGTVLTTESQNGDGGGSGMTNGNTTTGGTAGVVSSFAWWQSLPVYVQNTLGSFQNQAGNTSYVWTSADGLSWGAYQPGYSDFAVAANPSAGAWVQLPPGYEALLVQGGANVVASDGNQGHALIMGNSGADTVLGYGAGDTLVGSTGMNSLIWTDTQATIYGRGSHDVIVTGNAAVNVRTEAGGHSVLFLGAASGNQATVSGADTVVAVSGVGASDTITATGADTVFGPVVGQLTHVDGAAADVVVGNGGTMKIMGGTGNGSTIWCDNDSYTSYIGGSGSAIVVGGSGSLYVQGGSGAMTVYGGTGSNILQGSAGSDTFVTGWGASTVSAASGNVVWLVGAANDSLIAGGGNAILWGANSSGNNIFQAGSGPVTMHGGIGNDTLMGGSGNATMTGGGGADVFSFTAGLAGGTDVITDFSRGADRIQLHGYAGYSSSLVNGSEVLTLGDGTHIQLSGISSLSGVTISLV